MCGIVVDNEIYTHTVGLNNFLYINFTMEFNILDSVNVNRFYGRISKDLREKIKYQIKNYNRDKILLKSKTSSETLRRVLLKNNHWVKLQTLFSICNLLNIEEVYVKENITEFKTKDSFPIITKKILLNIEFARITGHLLGDGGIHINEKEGKYRIFYVNNNHVLLDSFSSDIKTIFPEIKLYKRIREERGDEIWLPTAHSSILYSIFNMKDCKLRRIPKFIYGETNKIKSALLQAFFDDEGYIYPQKYIIAISVSNRELLNDIKNLLEDLCIKSNDIKSTNSKTRSKMFYFYITGKNNIIKFFEVVGFLSPAKKTKLSMLVSKYGGKTCVE